MDPGQRQPHTRSSLGGDLARLGVTAGSVLLVHASLRSIGWVAGGAVAVLQAIRDVLGPDGTLVAPAFTGDYTDPQDWHRPPVPEHWWPVIRQDMPAFDPERTPSAGMGAIAECLRAWPGSRRSAHPNMSFTALGPHAARLVSEHPLDFGFGPRSPLGRLYEIDAKVLLLGVGYDRCTCFHLAEARWPGTRETTARAPVLRGGRRVWATFLDHLYNDRDFGDIGAAFEAGNRVAHGRVGGADCRLLPLRPAVDFALAWLARNRKPAIPPGTDKGSS
ncbi:MAG: AAC(3) family N-acetyltransferase [Alphaproteobacteria bacterium]|nr:AAC(3) family N-acetyltransferase [Alphaproteobacteria bacterium]